MSGVCIADPISGRKILSTKIPIKASLTIDQALLSNASIVFIPNSDHSNPLNINEDELREDDSRIWENKTTTNSNSKRNGGGLVVVQIERNGLRYLTPIFSDVDPTLPLSFLHQLHLVLESYISGPVNETSLKDNFDLVLELLEEMLSGGRPVLSEVCQLKELVEPPSQLLAKVANVAGLTTSNAQTNGTALLTSPLPWRRTGLKYSSNEIYFDITETLSYLLSSSSIVLSGNITGELNCRSKLSGMPDLNLSFNDPGLIEDCSFHSSVRYSRWGKDKVVSFIPPDGSFTLLSFLLSPPAQRLNTPLQPAHLTNFLPLIIKPLLTTGSLGSSLSLSITSLATSSNPITQLCMKFYLGKDISGFNAEISGGAGTGGSGGAGGSGGKSEKGRWEIEEDQSGERDGKGKWLIWWIGDLVAGDKPAILNCQFTNQNNSKPATALNITFETPTSMFSGLRIAGLVLAKNENYNVYKGVKLRGRGKVEIRC